MVKPGSGIVDGKIVIAASVGVSLDGSSSGSAAAAKPSVQVVEGPCAAVAQPSGAGESAELSDLQQRSPGVGSVLELSIK